MARARPRGAPASAPGGRSRRGLDRSAVRRPRSGLCRWPRRVAYRQLVAVRIRRDAEGIEDAEEAARELQHLLGAPPQLASPGAARRDRTGREAPRARARSRRRRRRSPTSCAQPPRSQARRPGPTSSPPTSVLSTSLTQHGRRRLLPVDGGTPGDRARAARVREQQAEGVQEAQREQFATLTLSTAVDLTQAALAQIQPTGGVDGRRSSCRDAMRVLFPEAVALVSAARQGFMRE